MGKIVSGDLTRRTSGVTMRLAHVLRMRLQSLFSRSAADGDLDEELQYHLERQIEENLRTGMTREEARTHALASIGGLQQRKEECRDARGLTMLDNLWADVRFGFRQLRKSPAFTCTAVLILSLGVTSAVATFGLVDAALIKPLPYRDPSRLVGVFETAPVFPRSNLSYPDYLDWKRQNQVLESFDIYTRGRFLLKTPEGNQPVQGARVTDGFFRTLGIIPVLGRDFRPGEDLPNAPRLAMLSFGAWQGRFGGRTDAIGRVVTLNGEAATIVGVLPRDFHYAPAEPAEFWTTFQASGQCDLRRSCHSAYGIGRLKDGVSVAAAQANFTTIAKSLETQYPDSNRGQGAAIYALRDVMVGEIRPVVLLLMTGAILLVVIATVNVASLLLVRSDSRRREFAVRSALGASAGRLVSQFVTEGSLLVLCSAGTGLMLGSWAMQLLVRLIPADMLASLPFLHDTGLNLRTLTFAVALSILALVIFSFTPAMRLSLSQVRAGLAEGGRGSAGLTWRRLGSRLVVVELAIAMVLLVGAGLLGKSLQRLLEVDIGFNPDRLALLEISAPVLRAESDEKKVAFAREILRRVAELPGVQSVALTSRPPVSGNGNTDWIRFEGRAYSGEHNEVNQREVSPDYFRTLQAELIRGRHISDADDLARPKVVVINQKLADLYFPGEDPIGKRFGDTELTPGSMREIVGIVTNIREGTLEEETWPAVYYPIHQSTNSFPVVIARTSQTEQSLLSSMVRTVRAMSPDVTAMPGATMRERIDASEPAYLRRSSAALVTTFAGLALFMSAVGLYGVVAYSVTQRTREIGVRIAMGAEQTSVYGLVMKEALVLTMAGIVLGLACSIAAATSVRKMLFNVEPWDAPTLTGVALALAAAALIASFVPARRAASLNPVVALRSE